MQLATCTCPYSLLACRLSLACRFALLYTIANQIAQASSLNLCRARRKLKDKQRHLYPRTISQELSSFTQRSNSSQELSSFTISSLTTHCKNHLSSLSQRYNTHDKNHRSQSSLSIISLNHLFRNDLNLQLIARRSNSQTLQIFHSPHLSTSEQAMRNR